MRVPKTSKSARSYLGYTLSSENYILKRTTKRTKKTPGIVI